MKFHPYEDVRLNTNKYEKEGFLKGRAGTVVDVYDDGSYEVDFSNLEVGSASLFRSFEEEDLSPISL